MCKALGLHCDLGQPGPLRTFHHLAKPRQYDVDAPFMHQGQEAGGNHRSLNWYLQQLNYFKPKACRTWLAHTLRVNKFGVCVSLIFFFFFLMTVYCLFSCVICIWLNESALFQSWYALWAVSEGMAESKPSCCSWTDLLYSCCLNDVQLFTAGTVSDMVTLVMSSLLCGLICFLRAVGLELQLCSVAPSGITAEGRRVKAEVADREVNGSRGENNILPAFLDLVGYQE